jgi:hypothetical protein
VKSAHFFLLDGKRIAIGMQELNEGSISTDRLPSGVVTLVLETSEGMISKRLMIVR